VYLQNFLAELGLENVGRIKLFSDNCGALKLAENPVFHNRTKHIDVKHHFVRGALENGHIEVAYKSTEDMAADVLTKGLSKHKHDKCIRMLGIESHGAGADCHPSIEGEC